MKIGNYTVESVGKHSYRFKKIIKGKTIRFSFDHKPTEREITLRLAERIQDEGGKSDTLRHCITEYIDNRESILSPSSIRTYRNFKSVISDALLDKDIYNITQSDIQKEINSYSKDHAPKSVRSLHGFISSVLAQYRPQFVLRTTLPRNDIKPRFRPNSDHIQAILKATEGTPLHVCVQLGILSLRRGEICALSLDDLKGNELHISKTMVYNKKWIVKETPKTEESNRTIFIPDSLADEIREQGFIFNLSPQKLNDHLHKVTDELGIPHFRFHDLRSYFASYASALDIPEADIMKMGGWKSDFVFKRIYRESTVESYSESSVKISESILNPSSKRPLK